MCKYHLLIIHQTESEMIFFLTIPSEALLRWPHPASNLKGFNILPFLLHLLRSLQSYDEVHSLSLYQRLLFLPSKLKKNTKQLQNKLWRAHSQMTAGIVALGEFAKMPLQANSRVHVQISDATWQQAPRRDAERKHPLCACDRPLVQQDYRARAFAWACSRAAVSLCKNCVAMESAVRPRCSKTREKNKIRKIDVLGIFF